MSRSFPVAGMYSYYFEASDGTHTVRLPESGGLPLEIRGMDTDGDGLLDSWEEDGFDFNNDGTIDVDLPALGAKKDHKDIFVQVDWLEKSGSLFDHSHKPSQETFDKVIEAFANAPVDNPDVVPGINIHIVFGQAIEENEDTKELGTVLDGCSYNWGDDFDEIKNQNFDPQKRPIFHYAIFAHDLPVFQCINGRPSGISRNPDEAFSDGAGDFIVALGGSWESYFSGLGDPVEFPLIVDTRAVVFMHELGHNLGLGHGGVVVNSDNIVVDAEHTNYKPNHLSVMNYSFGSRGLRKKNHLGLYWDGYLDYSRFGSDTLPDLHEISLNESDGLQASEAAKNYGTRYYCQNNSDTEKINGLQNPVDWNCDENINEENTNTNINKDKNTDGTHLLSTLNTVNEWQYLNYRGGVIGDFFNTAQLPTTTSMEVSPEITFEEDLAIDSFRPAVEVRIDIKPKESINSINLKSKGVVPVVVLSNQTFDATGIDPATITLANSPVKRKVDGRFMFSLEDANQDGLIDMVLKIETELLHLTKDDTHAVLQGATIDGLLIGGADAVNIVN